MGLVNQVISPDTLHDEAFQMAALIASKSPEVIAIGKKGFNKQIEMGVSEAYDHMSVVMADNMMHPHAVTGIKGFLEKRIVKW